MRLCVARLRSTHGKVVGGEKQKVEHPIDE